MAGSIGTWAALLLLQSTRLSGMSAVRVVVPSENVPIAVKSTVAGEGATVELAGRTAVSAVIMSLLMVTVTWSVSVTGAPLASAVVLVAVSVTV